MSETKVFDFLYLLFPTLASIAGGPLPFSWIDGIVNVRRNNGVLLSSKIERRHIIGEKVWHSQEIGFSIGEDVWDRFQRILIVSRCIGSGDPRHCLLSVSVGEGSNPPSDKASARFGQKC